MQSLWIVDVHWYCRVRVCAFLHGCVGNMHLDVWFLQRGASRAEKQALSAYQKSLQKANPFLQSIDSGSVPALIYHMRAHALIPVHPASISVPRCRSRYRLASCAQDNLTSKLETDAKGANLRAARRNRLQNQIGSNRKTPPQ